MDEEKQEVLHNDGLGEENQNKPEEPQNQDIKKEMASQGELENGAEEPDENVKKLEELNARYIRLMADFDNFKKRSVRQKQETYNNVLEEIVIQFLPVLDNFERAIDTAQNSEVNKNFTKGFELIFKQLKDVLGQLGLSEIEALGKPFDPYFHDAVMKSPSTDHEENTVIDVFQKGYMLKDKVIRPSMVKVSGS
jgi:molecular chaperone GrpE